MTRPGGATTDGPGGRVGEIFRDAGVAEVITKILSTVDTLDADMLAAAATAVPGRPEALATFTRSAVGTIEWRADRVPLQLLTAAALARIRGVLQNLASELDSYVADRDPAHLAYVLEDGMQNLYKTLRHCFGFWRLPADPAQVGTIRHLRLDVRCDNGGPALALMVDGCELLAEVGGRRYSCFPAAELLAAKSPLIPEEPGRFVPLYVADELPGGCLAALIHTWGDYVVWNAFRQFDGTFTPALQPEPDDGRPFGRPRTFDGRQYRAEVERAREELALAASTSANAAPPRRPIS